MGYFFSFKLYFISSFPKGPSLEGIGVKLRRKILLHLILFVLAGSVKRTQTTHLTSTTMQRWSWIILSIIFVGIIMSCAKAESLYFSDVEAMLILPKSEPPIITDADAINFAVHVNGVADSLLSAQKQANYQGWTVTAHRAQGFNGWKVLIHSKGKILPAYTCALSFTETGSLVTSGALCAYQK